MNADTGLLFIPAKLVLNARASHNLPYRNNRYFDYTYADFGLIPHAINVWAETGLDLTPEFVDRLWRDHAAKKEGNKEGERNRTCKLLLDALKAIYDHSAFAEYTRCQVLYRPKDDMLGRDLQIQIPDVGPVWLQMRVQINANYSQLKQQRRDRRGHTASEAIDACAYEDDVDKTAQPWFPKPAWYRRTVHNLRAERLGTLEVTS